MVNMGMMEVGAWRAAVRAVRFRLGWRGRRTHAAKAAPAHPSASPKQPPNSRRACLQEALHVCLLLLRRRQAAAAAAAAAARAAGAALLLLPHVHCQALEAPGPRGAALLPLAPLLLIALAHQDDVGQRQALRAWCGAAGVRAGRGGSGSGRGWRQARPTPKREHSEGAREPRAAGRTPL